MLVCLTVAAAVLLCGAIYDAKHRIIPNWIPLSILTIAVARGIIIPDGRMQQGIGFIVPAVMFVLLYVILNGKGLGGGDVKLIVALGALVGILPLFVLLFVASLAGLVYMRIRRMKSLAFAPFLTMGYIVTFWMF